MYINHKIRIKGTEEFLISKEKKGREVEWKTTLKSIKQSQLDDLECMCVSCNQYFEINLNHNLLHRTKYECFSCQRTGERNNFYGKKHTEDKKKSQSKLMKGRYVGVSNPFYGKKHTEDTKNILRQKCPNYGKDNGFYGKTHTNEIKQSLSEKAKQYAKENKELMSQKAIEALKHKKYKKTIPEKLTERMLCDLNIPYKYNKIITSVGQFDFIVSDNILLEVHGDYWHGNPNIYGEGKRPLNERQLYKKARDAVKKQLALQNGYKVFYIWEEQIMNEEWSVLWEIKRLLNDII